MSHLSNLLPRRNISNPNNPITQELLAGILSGPSSSSGKVVTPDTALQTLAVYACVRVISETIATLPLFTYKRLEDGKERATEHPLYHVLHDLPNPELTAVELRETIQAHVLLWGHGYAEVIRNNAGQVKQLWPLPPWLVTVGRNKRNELVYQIALPDGSKRNLRADRVLHISAMLGLSPISQARESIGLSMAAEEYGARFFSNDSRPGGVLVSEKKLSQEAANRLKVSWEASHAGGNAHRVSVLEEGLKWQQVGIPPQDAQFLETRQYQTSEIARLFRVPPHLIGDLTRSTYSNIEHQGIEFVTHTIRPWLVRWEQAINRTLLDEYERGRYFTEHLVDGLLRGDIKSRYEAYAVARQNGWLNANEIRAFENMNPYEGGDEYLVNSAMLPIDKLGEEPEPPPAPAPAPAQETEEEEDEE